MADVINADQCVVNVDQFLDLVILWGSFRRCGIHHISRHDVCKMSMTADADNDIPMIYQHQSDRSLTACIDKIHLMTIYTIAGPEAHKPKSSGCTSLLDTTDCSQPTCVSLVCKATHSILPRADLPTFASVASHTAGPNVIRLKTTFGPFQRRLNDIV